MGKWETDVDRIVDSTGAFLGRANNDIEADALCKFHNVDLAVIKGQRDGWRDKVDALTTRAELAEEKLIFTQAAVEVLDGTECAKAVAQGRNKCEVCKTCLHERAELAEARLAKAVAHVRYCDERAALVDIRAIEAIVEGREYE